VELGLCLPHVRPALEQGRRQVRRDGQVPEHFGERPPAGDASRVPAHQHAELVFGLGDLSLQLCHARRRAGHLRFELPHIQLGNESLIKPPAREPERLPVCREGSPRDLQGEVQLAELEIGGGDIRHEREDDRALILSLGQEVIPRRLGRAPDPAPEIELPRQVRGGLELVVGEGADAGQYGLGSAPLRVQGDLREEVTLGHAILGAELIDRGDGHPHIAILPECRLDQLAELRIAQQVEPHEIGRRVGEEYSPTGRGVG
jgi:hypothetical protein